MTTFEHRIDDVIFTEAVPLVNEYLNQFGASHYINAADNVSMSGGMEYALVGGGKDASKDAVIVMPSPFGNGAWPHIIARADAISYLAAQKGLRDESGNIVPVLVTASACKTSTYGLHSGEHADIASGNFSPLANRQLGVMKKLNRGQLLGFVGYSEAAVLAAPTFRNAGQDFDIFGNAVIGDPPHAKKRNMAALGIAFGVEGLRFTKQVKAEGIEVIDELFASKQAARDFNAGLLHRSAENLDKIRGFGRGGLACDLISLMQKGVDTTLIHASNSKIAPRKDVIAAFERASSRIKDEWFNSKGATLTRIEVRDTNHAFGDRVGRFATLAALGLV